MNLRYMFRLGFEDVTCKRSGQITSAPVAFGCAIELNDNRCRVAVYEENVRKEEACGVVSCQNMAKGATF